MRTKLLTVAAIALATAFVSPLFATRTEAQQAKAPEPPPTPVEVAKADIARIAPRHWAPGSVVSRDDAKLATSAAGRLEYVAEVGTRLKSGERVYALPDATLGTPDEFHYLPIVAVPFIALLPFSIADAVRVYFVIQLVLAVLVGYVLIRPLPSVVRPWAAAAIHP